MSGKLSGSTAIVTGSSAGIGKAIATAFAKEGANVVTNSRSEERAAATATEITEAGGTALPVEADVTDRDEVQALVDTTVAEFGGLDVMVNNAGVTAIEPMLEMEPEEWRWVLDINLTGVFFGSQAAGKQMVEQETGGQIINVSSIFGSVGVQGRAAYNASKGGVNNLTRCLAVELAEHDVHVNALAPGFIQTELVDQTSDSDADEDRDDTSWPYYGFDDQHIQNRTPLGRYGTREEISNWAVFLAGGDHYTTGEIIHPDGGWTAFGWGSKGR